MPISYVGGAESQSTTGAAITLTLPAGVREGDLVLVFEGQAGNALSGMTTAGYATHASGTASAALACYYKFMGPTPDTTAVIAAGVSSEGHAGIAKVYRGVDRTVPFDVAATQTTGSSTNPNPPANTPVTFGVHAVVAASSHVSDTSVTAPTNYINQVDINSNAAVIDVTIGAADRILAVRTAEDPAAWTTWSTAAWRTMTLMLRPALLSFARPFVDPVRRKGPSPALVPSFFWSGFGRVPVFAEQVQTRDPVRRKGLSAAVIAAGLFWSGHTPSPTIEIERTSFVNSSPQLHRRTLLYQSHFEPLPTSVTGPGDVLVSGVQASQLYRRSLLYPSLQEPLRVEPAILDRWHKALSEPVRAPPRPTSQQFLAWSEKPVVAGPDIWWPPLAEPIRTRPRQTAGLVWAPFQLEARDWLQPFSEPVRAKPSQAWQQSFIGVMKPEPGTDDTRPDQWYSPFSEPRRRLAQQAPSFSYGYFTPPVVADYLSFNVSVDIRFRKTLHPSIQQGPAAPIVETVSVDKWQLQSTVPARARYRPTSTQYLVWTVHPFEQDSRLPWYRPFNEPVRAKRRGAENTFFTPLVDTGVKFASTTVSVQYRRALLYPALHAAIIIQETPGTDDTRPDQWHRQFSEPTRRKATIHPPAFNWGVFTPPPEPFLVTTEVHFQRLLMYQSVQAPTEIVDQPTGNIRALSTNVSVQYRRSLLYPALQDAARVPGVTGTNDTRPDQWHRSFSEPRWSRRGLLTSQHVAFWYGADPNLTPTVEPGNITSTLRLNLPVDVVLHGQQIEYKISNYSNIPTSRTEIVGHFPRGKVRRLKGKKPSFIVRSTKKGYNDKDDT